MIGARAIGGVLLAIGVIAFVATLGVGDGWSASGPRLAPAVSSVLLIALAALFLARPGPELADHIAEASEGTHWPTPALLLGLLIGYALLLGALGYALATTIFFWLTAWLLGSEKPARDLLVGVLIGALTSFVFSELLNVQLPQGPWGV